MAKGQSFEREVCKSLSIWYSAGVRDDIFWRTAGSGARATVRAKQGKTTCMHNGDVTATHPIAKRLLNKFVIEIKRGYTAKKDKNSLSKISILDLIDKPDKFKTKPILIQWWEKLQEEIKSCGLNKNGLLISRRDRRQAIIVMDRHVFKSIEEKKPCIFPPYNPGCWLNINNLSLQIMTLDNFFHWVNPEILDAKRFLRKVGSKLHKGYIPPGPYPNMTADYYKYLKQAVNIV